MWQQRFFLHSWTRYHGNNGTCLTTLTSLTHGHPVAQYVWVKIMKIIKGSRRHRKCFLRWKGLTDWSSSRSQCKSVLSLEAKSPVQRNFFPLLQATVPNRLGACGLPDGINFTGTSQVGNAERIKAASKSSYAWGALHAASPWEAAWLNFRALPHIALWVDPTSLKALWLCTVYCVCIYIWMYYINIYTIASICISISIYPYIHIPIYHYIHKISYMHIYPPTPADARGSA